MVTIVFEPHATTSDNEVGLASGWNDIALSELGRRQAKELGARRKLSDFGAVFTSDLERAYLTARLAQHPKDEVDTEKPKRVNVPFPDGESYKQASERMRSFLRDLLQFHDDQIVLVIGHRATQYGLEHWVNGASLEQAVTAPWKWQPGWTYEFNNL